MFQRRITFILCAAEILGMWGIATFPSLLPTFLAEWHLSHTEAGWISAVYYGGYMLTVPLLVGLTDRVDARKIMFLGVLIGGLTAFAFARFASGFWSAMLVRFLAGVSLAGTYMPGLKVVSDHTEGPLQSRYISFYTASFSIGASLSYLLAGEVNARLGWRWAFAASGSGPVLALGLIAWMVPAAKVHPFSSDGPLIDFKPVLHAREALSYILGYAAHMWELFGMRSWIVAFLVYSRSLQPEGAFTWSATQLAFLINLIGLPSSICGNELCRRFGRRRVITRIMLVSAVLGAIIGFLPFLPFGVVAVLSLAYGVTVTADSASLTAGAVKAAPHGSRGATLAVHSTLGFGAAFLAPLTFGMVLDLFQAHAVLGWGFGFLLLGLGCATGPVFLAAFRGRAAAGTERDPRCLNSRRQ
jgi:MFS family permease